MERIEQNICINIYMYLYLTLQFIQNMYNFDE